MYRFTIRDLILVTALISVGIAWWLDHRRLAIAQDRLATIVAELASRDIEVEIDADGIWVSNPQGVNCAFHNPRFAVADGGGRMNAEVQTTGFGDANALSGVLRPWRGGRAQVRSFSSSHDRLSLWITKPQTDWVIGDSLPGGVLLDCIKCVSIQFVPVWGPIDIQVSGVARDGNGESLRLRDASWFEVTCWDAQIHGVFDDHISMCKWLEG